MNERRRIRRITIIHIIINIINTKEENTIVTKAVEQK